MVDKEHEGQVDIVIDAQHANGKLVKIHVRLLDTLEYCETV